MARIKRVERGMLEATGATITEAKAGLDAQIDDALSGSYDPAIVKHGEYSAMVYRTPRGWEYRLFDADRPMDAPGITNISGNCLMGNVSRAEAIQEAVAHVVGLDGADYHTLDELPPFLTDRSKGYNIITTRRFNRAYRYAKANHPDGSEHGASWHAWAGNNMHDPRFV
jgi:hypothetical protein